MVSSAYGQVSFQEGVDGYAGTADTYLQNTDLNPHGSGDQVFTLDDLSSGVEQHGLLRFDGIFGPGKIPLGSPIISATLTINVRDASGHAAPADVDVHRMLGPWNENDGWDVWGDSNSPHNGAGGIQTPDEAVLVPDLTIPGPIPAGTLTIDVTNSVQAWSDGASNFGWVFFIQPLNEQWSFSSSEETNISLRPKLVVTWVECEDWIFNPSTSHWYRLTNITGTWEEAEAEALTAGGHLASIQDLAENQWLLSTFGDDNRWIGLYQPPGSPEPGGGWTWSDGSPVTYTNWCSGEPNDDHEGEHWAELKPTFSFCAGRWNDLGLASMHSGIIERTTDPCGAALECAEDSGVPCLIGIVTCIQPELVFLDFVVIANDLCKFANNQDPISALSLAVSIGALAEGIPCVGLTSDCLEFLVDEYWKEERCAGPITSCMTNLEDDITQNDFLPSPSDSVLTVITLSPVEVEVMDEIGNVMFIDSMGNLNSTIDGGFILKVVDHQRLAMVLNPVGSYVVTIRGNQDAGAGDSFDLGVLYPTDEPGIYRNVVYQSVPTRDGAIATLSVDEISPDFVLSMDLDGDGIFELSQCPDFIDGVSVESCDADGDGVSDGQDFCPNTEQGSIVDDGGCSISQLVPCSGPTTGGYWKNHGEYVSSVAKTTEGFVAAGLITEAEKGAIVSKAGRSNCGK